MQQLSLRNPAPLFPNLRCACWYYWPWWAIGPCVKLVRGCFGTGSWSRLGDAQMLFGVYICTNAACLAHVSAELTAKGLGGCVAAGLGAARATVQEFVRHPIFVRLLESVLDYLDAKARVKPGRLALAHMMVLLGPRNRAKIRQRESQEPSGVWRDLDEAMTRGGLRVTDTPPAIKRMFSRTRHLFGKGYGNGLSLEEVVVEMGKERP